MRDSRSWATRWVSFNGWKYRRYTLRSESFSWNSISSGSSSGRIGRMITSSSVLRHPGRPGAADTAESRISAAVFLHVEAVNHDPRVERQQPLRRSQQRVDVDFLDPALLDNQLAEAHQQLFQRGDIDRRATANSFQRGEDFGLLHQAPRQGGVQRRQRQGAVLEDFDQLAAGAEEHDRTELRIQAAADDQLIAVELHHRLNGHALEVLGADLSVTNS